MSAAAAKGGLSIKTKRFNSSSQPLKLKVGRWLVRAIKDCLRDSSAGQRWKSRSRVMLGYDRNDSAIIFSTPLWRIPDVPERNPDSVSSHSLSFPRSCSLINTFSLLHLPQENKFNCTSRRRISRAYAKSYSPREWAYDQCTKWKRGGSIVSF